jgi:hypothetical protein
MEKGASDWENWKSTTSDVSAKAAEKRFYGWAKENCPNFNPDSKD